MWIPKQIIRFCSFNGTPRWRYTGYVAAAAFWVYLALITDAVVLLLGGLCFLCGVFYSFGPVSISRLPLGEVMSGLFYGFYPVYTAV